MRYCTCNGVRRQGQTCCPAHQFQHYLPRFPIYNLTRVCPYRTIQSYLTILLPELSNAPETVDCRSSSLQVSHMPDSKCTFLIPVSLLIYDVPRTCAVASCTTCQCMQSKTKIFTTDSAGLRFVVTTPVQKLENHDRKAIRRHATRAGVKDRQRFHLRSWISPNRELGALGTAEGVTNSKPVWLAPSPRRVGGAFSGLQLPSGIEPDMIQDLVKCIYRSASLIYFNPFHSKTRLTRTS